MKHRIHNIKRQHHIPEGMLPVLEQIKQIDGVNGIIPGKIYPHSQCGERKVSIQRETQTGLKLFIHNKKELQEIFVLCDKSKISTIINEINKQFGITITQKIKKKQKRPQVLNPVEHKDIIAEGYYFLTLTDKHLDKIKNFSKLVEEKYDKDTLTGINFLQMKDRNFLLGLVFTNEEKRDETISLALSEGFKKYSLLEQKWGELASHSKICIIGSFTYAILNE